MQTSSCPSTLPLIELDKFYRHYQLVALCIVLFVRQSSSHFKMTKDRRHESSKLYISVVRAVKVPNVPGAVARTKLVSKLRIMV